MEALLVPLLLFLSSLPHTCVGEISRRDTPAHPSEPHPEPEGEQCSRVEDLQKLSKKLQNKKNLMRLPPWENKVSSGPVGAKCQVALETIHRLDEVKMQMTISFILHMTWNDTRLANPERMSPLVLPGYLEKLLWKPDVTIESSKKQSTTIDNTAVRIGKYGDVSLSVKMSTTVICLMQLSTFPLDRQTCELGLYSFEYFSDELLLFWDDHTHTISVRSGEAIAAFKLEHHNATVRKERYCHGHTTSGPVSQFNESDCRYKNFLIVEFEFKRFFFSVFFISYLPATVMVFVGVLATFIDPLSVPARVVMGITTVLTISTVIQGLKASLPAVSYLTALDIYLWISFFFVAVTLVEFAYLNHVTVVIPRYKKERRGGDQKQGFEAALAQAFATKRFFQQISGSKGGVTSRLNTPETSRKPLLSPDSNAAPGSSGLEAKPSEILYNDVAEAQNSDSRPTKTKRSPSVQLSPADREKAKAEKEKEKEIGNHQRALQIDRRFRIGYTISYLLFNVVYWIYFWYAAQDDHE